MRSVVLCVDFEMEDQVERSSLLQRNNYEVLSATSTVEAINIFSIHFVDAVILGGENSEETGTPLTHMKTAKPHVPIMLLSGYEELSEDALGYVDAYIYHAQPEHAFLLSLDRLLNVSSRFFSRWMDNWRVRMKTRDSGQKKAA